MRMELSNNLILGLLKSEMEEMVGLIRKSQSRIEGGLKLETWMLDNPSYDLSEGFGDQGLHWIVEKERQCK